MAYVYHATTGTYREVSNLGWLLRHASEATEVRVYLSEDGAVMHVELTGNRLFMTDWESEQACREWLKRPSMKDVPTRFIEPKTN